MRIDVCRGGKIAVSEPVLNLLHGNAVCKHQRGTAMSQIMKSDLTKLIRPKQLAEALCNIMGLDQIADLVDTDIFLIFLDVDSILGVGQERKEADQEVVKDNNRE